MCRIACALRRFRRLTIVVLGMAVAFVAALMPATAADFIPSGSPIPQGIRWANATPTGVNTSAWATSNGTVSKFPVPVASSTLGKLAKGAVKKGLPVIGWATTLKGIIDGAGWLIDELQQQIVTPGQAANPLESVAWCTLSPSMGVTQTTCVSSKAETCAATTRISNQICLGVADIDSPTQIMWRTALPSNPTVWNGNLVWNQIQVPESAVNANPSSDPQPVSNYDLGQLLKHHPEVVNAILIDPETGAPIRTQELVNALNALAAQLAAANGDPAPTPVEVDPDIETGTNTPSQTDWPGFCDWAPTVCEFIDWMKKPEPEEEKPEVPWDETPPETVEWSSGLGAGSCPAPVSFSVTIGPVSASPEFELQPICDFGEKIRPLVIALASLVGVFIVGGWRNGKNA